jgi:hypothetical protein
MIVAGKLDWFTVVEKELVSLVNLSIRYRIG